MEGGVGQFCPVKCDMGSAPTHHTNVQGQKEQERVGFRTARPQGLGHTCECVSSLVAEVVYGC